MMILAYFILFFFFLNDTATTEIYTVRNTLSLHDALPICGKRRAPPGFLRGKLEGPQVPQIGRHTSELQSLRTISYAVFCLKKKKNIKNIITSYHIKYRYHIRFTY